MEVATTNTHHHNHHHQHLGHQLHHPAHRLPMAKSTQHQQQQQQSNHCLTVSNDSAQSGGGGGGGSPRSPFQREVREWQRIYPDTGALLSGRLEADRWINGPLNSYGKISDSQNISQPNGTQHTQRKQLEVLQKRTANGAVQVIRAQTVQTSSSRSWSSSNSNSASTSASASASASPICMQANVVGARSLLHNHNNSNSISNNNNSINNINSSKHFHSTLQQHLAEANTHWLQLSPPTIAATVDISEVSTDDDLDKAVPTIAETPYIVDDSEIDVGNGCGDDADINASATLCNYSISRSGSAGSGGGGSSKGHALLSSAASSSSTLHSQSSALLVPDTAPSLKLSNLMKSSSGGSSSSNNSTKLNTHKSAGGKVSLHAIVGSAGDNNNNSGSASRINNDLTESPKSTATTAKSSNEALSGIKTWQQQRSNARHLEQATLYGQNSNSSKMRVGGADCDDCYAVVSADADESQLRYHQHHLQPQQLRKQQQQQQQSSVVLSETTPPTRRRDLESFRLYGDSTTAATTAGAAADDNAKADDLRLSTRQLRRQQQPFGQLSSSALLQRSHSISTDDLSNEWESNEAVAESNEWRRVSKLRRSFQSSSTANNSNTSDPAVQQPPSSIRRPYDLPASAVSVSRIRAELESGRRLTTAMRNNHVDLAALESILHGPDKTTGASSRNTLLTAESLKEIRGRLKKLSDESLYKDDFIAYQQPPSADEHIEVQQSVRRKLSTPRLQQLTPEESPEISTATQHTSAFKVVGAQRKPTDNDSLTQRSTHLNQKHTSNSLESRQKQRDTNSTEWHSRRKSYGFEKMSPPDNKTMHRMDASTDSGLGRSGELGNWSPTEAAPPRATVIHFGEPAKAVTSAHYRAAKSPLRRTPDEDLLKRHSIAVDESQYVRDNLRKTSQVHLNGFYEPAEPAAKSTVQLSRYDSNAESNQLFQRNTQNAQKRVEFCKTEVHFAAESGRVNIVETDGKPPPTNNFRRRRRTTSGPLQSLTKTASTAGTSTAVSTTTASNVTHFGDDQHQQQRHRTIASSVVAYKATLVEPPTVLNDAQIMPATTNVTVSVQHAEGSRGSYASTTSGVDTTDNENDEIAAIRGILKNKPVKPKPYHLGENIDSADALWGVQLKPVAGGGSSAAREKEDSPTAVLNKSVAERVRIVEKRHEHSAPNGYSTKINLSLDEPAAAARDWPNAGAPMLMPNTDNQPIPNNTNRRASAQELILQDLREHQRMLDEGLKSTSLIIKTMRSANEFDEAMRRLSIASLESSTMPPIVVPTPMLRSNSYQETVRRYSNASLESTERELTTQTVVHTSSSAAALTAATSSRRLSFETQSAFVTPLSLPPAPLVAPRLKLLGSTEVAVSQQLSQLRRMYDIAATQQENDEDAADSADEEVKSYFCAHEQAEQSDSGGGTLESSSQEDERAIEYSSGSWSRMKAKRTIWKIEAEERKAAPAVLDKADLPKSNIMSIELHSPQTSLEKRDSIKRNQTPPVAKPRTVTGAVNATQHPQIHVATTVKQTADRFSAAEQQRQSLKIVKEARGARKLREHELSYFGVPHGQKHEENETKPKQQPNSNANTLSLSKRSLPSRQRLTVIGNEDTKSMRRHEANNTETTTVSGQTQTATKWQLLNDKPDLLRHSPIAVEPQLIRRTADVQRSERNSTSVERNKRMPSTELRLDDELNDAVEDDDDDNEHFYENITNEITPVFKVKSPQPYDRKMDMERDAFILNEMNENADLTMKALSDEAAHKDRRRRRSSLHRRDSKPLETIEEKLVTQKPNDTCIAVKMSRGTLASEAKRHARHTTTSPSPHDTTTRVRTSSQSSVESCPRARSRSLSSEREYENIRTPKPTRTNATATTKIQAKSVSKQQQRSSSRESQRSARLPYSSGDEVNPREEQRVRMKSKRSSNSTSGTTGRSGERQRSSGSSKKDSHHDKHGHHTTTTSSRDVEQRRRAASSTTHASQREERGECVTVPQQQRTASSGRSSSSNKRREEPATNAGSSGRHSSSRNATEKARTSAGVRLLRSLRVGRTDDAKASSTEQRASGHHRSTSEREKAHEKEREKELQSKSRGHSTSKTQHHSSSEHHQHSLTAHSGTMSSKTREHKKATSNAIEKPHERATTPTHSKSSQNINGRHNTTGQHDGHRKHNDHKRAHTRPQQEESRTTKTTTTQRKRSEHSARERT
ncbi:pneumococcal serine-rich repeat protein isoform X1 [Zeugodacus cucurbitae]|uniref:pneumococcal serine-rich repeat protein isoform X1 n=1 Tax=Zeugodacus cucurbitae TaxID=28588 RepID=UPI0023D93B54|nr:pneumococcal serine-rich repeat protein isoform X1 [Zeugodacus cucurbitae]XP_028893769.2 pneumococcal serine-rich repeat protein isoform X1 [Zeugodacus cucurbitae]XP_028893770.2 pneumococcal serine-rich repeat protein isoform X1 [Zeugodacus cucurbitae]XP_054082960.1 pneumococcal serine-rich repeat protein isoform X1 [Zeugodacus cucurbitae]